MNIETVWELLQRPSFWDRASCKGYSLREGVDHNPWFPDRGRSQSGVLQRGAFHLCWVPIEGAVPSVRHR